MKKFKLIKEKNKYYYTDVIAINTSYEYVNFDRELAYIYKSGFNKWSVVIVGNSKKPGIAYDEDSIEFEVGSFRQAKMKLVDIIIAAELTNNLGV